MGNAIGADSDDLSAGDILMAQTYYVLTTDVGLAAITAAANGGDPLTISAMAIGDAGGADPTFTGAETALINELNRFAVESVTIPSGQPTQRKVRAVVPAEFGGFTIREVGLFSSDGDLVAIAKYPPTVKPPLSQGFGTDLAIEIIMNLGRGDVTVVDGGSQVFVTNESLLQILNQYRDTWFENRW